MCGCPHTYSPGWKEQGKLTCKLPTGSIGTRLTEAARAKIVSAHISTHCFWKLHHHHPLSLPHTHPTNKLRLAHQPHPHACLTSERLERAPQGIGGLSHETLASLSLSLMCDCVCLYLITHFVLKAPTKKSEIIDIVFLVQY